MIDEDVWKHVADKWIKVSEIKSYDINAPVEDDTNSDEEYMKQIMKML